jgi:hypothetical protein
MTERRTIPSILYRRYSLVNLSYVAPGAAGFITAVLNRQDSALFTIGATTFLLALLCGVLIDYVRDHRFRCPCCDRRIPFSHPQNRESVSFLCAHCDVLWDTQTFIPD